MKPLGDITSNYHVVLGKVSQKWIIDGKQLES